MPAPTVKVLKKKTVMLSMAVFFSYWIVAVSKNHWLKIVPVGASVKTTKCCLVT